MGVANKMGLLVLGSCTYWQFMVLEGKDCDENAHEGGHGRC